MKEFGDFQTNSLLSSKVCKLLLELGVNPSVIIEPTCGEGNFLLAANSQFKNCKKILGIELQKHYIEKIKDKISSDKKINQNIEIINADVFDYDFGNISLKEDDRILLIGNPPWVTNSNLNGKNLPKKSNFKKNNGLDAITGKANFDISEFILLHLFESFKKNKGHSAFLCKTQVARNIIEFLPSTDLDINNIKIYEFDSMKEFNVSVDACLFYCEFGNKVKSYQCEVYKLDESEKMLRKFGWHENKFISDLTKYKKIQKLDGVSQLVWRSGIKHDCSAIMELTKSKKLNFKNKIDNEINIEDNYIFPLLKSSNLKGGVLNQSDKYIIVTQKKPGEDTAVISKDSPKLWHYLNSHKTLFDKRKSVIYKKNPIFSIFGIGDYSFKPYKIAVSGLYKKPSFTLLLPQNKKTIMVDDSCYILSFDNLKNALITFAILNSKEVSDLLESIVFLDSKRPYTKNILMRIDIKNVLNELTFQDIIDFLKKRGLFLEDINKKDYNHFLNSLE
ncbi:SAM-dependent methyltransferase [Candidatus Gracilibacteria bacterium]|nr:SAM-dependent methyltransferase [Candidatus Gracilibacteria bacterium]